MRLRESAGSGPAPIFLGLSLFKPLYAILLDGGFLTKKLYAQHRRDATADDIVAECDRLRALDLVKEYELLRIYYYDATPAAGTVPQPVTRASYNLSTTDRYRKSQALFDTLVLKPHFALRMGEVNLSPEKWRIKPSVTKELVKTGPRPLTDSDFLPDLKQKGVDMRIGMDMARLCLRDMIRAVIVVTGDSDFVPAFKFVRREGVKVFLDPMGHNVRQELRQHSDVVI